MEYGVWRLAHILLFVYWLGADLGVLLLAKRVKDDALDFKQRMLLLEMAVVIDLLPRLCFAVMFPVGLEMAVRSGLIEAPTWVRVVAWLVALAWVTLILAMARGHSERLARVQAGGLILLGIGLLVLGGVALTGDGPVPADWLGLKILLFGVICLAAVGIDWEFKPLLPAMSRLAAEGSSPEIEADICCCIDKTVRYVYLLYGTLVAMAVLGVLKPF